MGLGVPGVIWSRRLSSLYEAWFVRFGRDAFDRKFLLRRDGESVGLGAGESVTVWVTVGAGRLFAGGDGWPR